MKKLIYVYRNRVFMAHVLIVFSIMNVSVIRAGLVKIVTLILMIVLTIHAQMMELASISSMDIHVIVSQDSLVKIANI